MRKTRSYESRGFEPNSVRVGNFGEINPQGGLIAILEAPTAKVGTAQVGAERGGAKKLRVAVLAQEC